MMSKLKNQYYWLSLSVVIIFLDQVTKTLASAALYPYEPVPITSFFNFTLMYNEGAAFSLLSDAGGWQKWFLIGVTAIVIVAILIWFFSKQLNTLTAAALSLVLGGAIGNLYDRIVYHHVIDFLDFYVGTWHWPAFNVADSAITVGAVLLVIDIFRK